MVDAQSKIDRGVMKMALNDKDNNDDLVVTDKIANIKDKHIIYIHLN